MFGWIKKRVLEASADAMRNDIERFTAGLAGADDGEISSLLIVANSMRLKLVESGKIPPAALDLSIPRDDDLTYQCDMCPVVLSGIIRQFQEIGQPSDAAGVMVWLHSVRALNVPEIRIFGRLMWKQLERGFPHIDEKLVETRILIPNKLPQEIDKEVRFIPFGLEP